MSLLSDLFKGDFGNLGTDIVDAPSSLVSHPDELVETVGGALALTGLGLGADALFGGADLAATASTADLTAANEAFGTFDPGLFEANTADVLAGGTGTDIAFPSLSTASTDLATELDAPLSTTADSVGQILSDAPASEILGGVGDDVTTGTSIFGGDVAPDVTASLGDTAGQLGTETTGATVDTGAPDTTSTTTTTLPAGTPSVSATTTAQGTVAPVGQPASSGGTVATPSTGITGTLDKIISSPWTKLALGATPLALTLALGEEGLPATAKTASDTATTLSAQGAQDLKDARAGKLTSGQISTLKQNRQDLTNAWAQTLYNQGIQDPTKDTRWPQILGVIDDKITAQTETMINDNITAALKETGQASDTLLKVADLQLKSDSNFTSNLVNATKSLGSIAGGTTLKLSTA